MIDQVRNAKFNVIVIYLSCEPKWLRKRNTPALVPLQIFYGVVAPTP